MTVLSALTYSQIPTYSLGTDTVMVSGYNSSGDVGAGAVFTQVGATSGGPMAVQDASGAWYNLVITYFVRAAWFGIMANFGSNQSSATQSMISWCAANNIRQILFDGGTYICGGLTVPNNVMLIGVGAVGSSGQDSGTDPNTRFQAPTGGPSGGWILTDGGVRSQCVSIMGIDFYGNGAQSYANGGINVTNGATSWVIERCNFNNFNNEAIKTSSGVGHKIKECFAQNCLLSTSLATNTGVFNVGGTDVRVDDCEITASTSSLFSVNFYKAAFYVNGANHFYSNCVGEISDCGFYFTNNATQLRMTNCRGDTCFGPGFVNYGTGGSVCLTNCTAYDNSQAGVGNYPGFTTVGGGSYALIGCFASGPNHSYGFVDTSTYASLQQRGSFTGCRSISHVTAAYNVSPTASYSQSCDVGNAQLEGTGATPNVDGAGSYYATDASPVTITNFLNGVPGQILFVLGANANQVSIANNTNIVTISQGTLTLATRQPVLFKYSLGKWYQLSGSSTASGFVAPTYPGPSGATGQGLYSVGETILYGVSTGGIPNSVRLTSDGNPASNTNVLNVPINTGFMATADIGAISNASGCTVWSSISFVAFNAAGTMYVSYSAPTATNITAAGTLQVNADQANAGVSIIFIPPSGATGWYSYQVIARVRTVQISNTTYNVVTKPFVATPLVAPQLLFSVPSLRNIAQIPTQQAQNQNQMGPNYNSGTPANSGPWF